MRIIKDLKLRHTETHMLRKYDTLSSTMSTIAGKFFFIFLAIVSVLNFEQVFNFWVVI